MNDDNFNVRTAALDRLAEFGSNKQSGLAIAVERLNHENLLWRIVVNDGNDNLQLRLAAMEKIKSQDMLAAVAASKPKWSSRAETYCEIRVLAVKRITDQAILAEIANGGYSWPVRLAAAEKLTDQALVQPLLSEIAELRLESEKLEKRKREEDERNQANRSRRLQEQLKDNCHHDYVEIESKYCDFCRTWAYTHECQICRNRLHHICT